jgi:hypothetical protein
VSKVLDKAVNCLPGAGKIAWLCAVLFCFAATCFVQGQSSQPAVLAARHAPETELAVVDDVSVGHFRIFGFAEDRQIYPVGLEYDRHSWGGLFKARVDYVAQLLPVVLMSEPDQYKLDSTALSKQHQLKYGADISPIGIRLLWRRDKAFKPFLISKGGLLYFKDRVLSAEAPHIMFSAEFGGGIEERVSHRIDLRGGYELFHVSNGNIGRVNPGIDFGAITAGVGYRFGK